MRSTVLFFASMAAVAAQEPTFTRDVLPVFEKNCLGCHTATAKMGSLELETYEGVKKGGNHGAIVVPGNSAESRLYLMIAGKMQPAMPLSGQTMTAGEIETVRKWIDAGAKPGEPARSAKAAVPVIRPKGEVKAAIGALAWSPDGQLLALGAFKEVRLAGVSGKTIAVLPGHAEAVRAVAFSRDGKWLAAAGGLPGRKGEVKIWDVAARREARTLQGHADCIYAAAFSPDGKWLATGSYDKLIKLWDVATGKEVRTLKDHIDAVYALAFTPDGTRLASAAADRTIKVWDPATGERLFTFSDATDGLNTVAIDPEGKRVAAGGLDKTIRIWSLAEKRLLVSQIAHEDAILRLAWSPDGKLLASSGADRTVKLFRVADLSEVKVFGAQPDWVQALEFSPDGARLAEGRFDGSFEMETLSR